jgi:hypothetical protein
MDDYDYRRRIHYDTPFTSRTVRSFPGKMVFDSIDTSQVMDLLRGEVGANGLGIFYWISHERSQS